MFKKNFERIETLLNKLDLKITQKMNEKDDPREKAFFETLDAKGKLETERAKLLKEQINLKDTIKELEKSIKNLEENNDAQKKTIQELTSEINTLVKYKNERAAMMKEIEKLQKKLDKLEAEGMVLPKRVRKTGVTKDNKQVVGIKPSKVSGATKSELNKINELREKEAV